MTWSSVFCVLMLFGILRGVYDIPYFMYVSSPPPCLCCLSVLWQAKLFMCGVLFLLFSLDSCMVMMSALIVCASCSISVVLRSMPFVLICRMLRLELGL